jgi:hypothetical protein
MAMGNLLCSDVIEEGQKKARAKQIFISVPAGSKSGVQRNDHITEAAAILNRAKSSEWLLTGSVN